MPSPGREAPKPPSTKANSALCVLGRPRGEMRVRFRLSFITIRPAGSQSFRHQLFNCFRCQCPRRGAEVGFPVIKGFALFRIRSDCLRPHAARRQRRSRETDADGDGCRARLDERHSDIAGAETGRGVKRPRVSECCENLALNPAVLREIVPLLRECNELRCTALDLGR